MRRAVNSEHLQRVVVKARKDPFFLGQALAEYETLYGIDDQQLKDWLGCTSEALERLSLCRLPNEGRARFQQDVLQIAKFAPCNADRLIKLIREVAAFTALKGEAQERSSGLLMAARDRKSDDDNSAEKEEDEN